MRTNLQKIGKFGLLAIVAALFATHALAKPSAAITIGYEFNSEPVVGLPLDISVTVSAQAEMYGVDVRLAAGDPLAMINPLGPMGLAVLEAYEDAVFPVTVLPLVEQTHYLNVTVTSLVEGEVQSKSIAVPIRLGDARLTKDEGETAGTAGEAVHSFRAVETIR